MSLRNNSPRAARAIPAERQKMNIPASITVHASDRLAWRAGRLHEVMAVRYPMVFDADDLRLARTQHKSGSHYTEWAVAAWLWDRLRLRSLVEKYEFTSQHPVKAATLARLGISIERRPDCQYPDLIVYDAAGEWEFVEVKTRADVLRQTQSRFYEILRIRHGKTVKILRLVEK